MNDSINEEAVKTDLAAPLMMGVATFLLLFGVVGYWFVTGNIAGAVIAPGVVAVKGKPKTIQHLDGGIVAEIRVADGEVVNKNETLIRLDDKLLKTNLKIYKNRIEEALVLDARLRAERNNLARINWSIPQFIPVKITPNSKIKESQQELFDLRRITRNGQKAQLEETINQYGNQINGVNGLIGAKNNQLKFISEELLGLRKLYEKGNTTLTRILNLERQKADLVGQLAEHSSELARINNSINETRIQILQLDREVRQTAQTEMQTNRIEINGLVQQIIATEEQLKRIEIRAPVSGIVHELSVFTVGGVIGPGAPIMQIIPQTSGVNIEAHVEPQFIDKLFEGQKTNIRFTAFSKDETPEVEGKIIVISASSIVDEATKRSFYVVTLELTSDELEKLAGKKLVPGMPVEVFIQTRMRTALNYILKPFLDQVYRAFREE